MKIQFENWKGWKLSATYVRHTIADRYTIRIGQRAVSLLVSYRMEDEVSPVLSAVAKCYGFVMGGMLVGYYVVGSIVF